MPTKAELYAQMADKVATQLTGSWQEWAGFLTTASRLYKYPFHEQLMIYAQRPDATACAEYDLWNEKMGRYVRRGSKGIALVDDSGDRPRLRYVFDISDTGTREHSRTPWLWQLEERHLDSVHPAALFWRYQSSQRYRPCVLGCHIGFWLFQIFYRSSRRNPYFSPISGISRQKDPRD